MEVDYNGTVARVDASKLKTSCILDLKYFPFDRQACYIHIDSWVYTTRQLKIQLIENMPIHEGKDTPSGQWVLGEASGEIVSEVFGSSFNYDSAKFTVILTRKPGYYMLTLICPCLMVSALEVLMFLLPADAGEKVSLGITGLLSFSVSLLMIADSLPRQSDQIPLMSRYSMHKYWFANAH